MLLYIIINIILSSASVLKRDFSILLTRVTLYSLLTILVIIYNSSFFFLLQKGLSLYNGLFQSSCNTHVFSTFLFLLTFFILTLTSFYPRKIFLIINETIVQSDIEIDGLKGALDKITDKLNIDENSSKKTSPATDMMYSNINSRQDYLEKVDLIGGEYKAQENDYGIVIDRAASQFKILEYSLLILFVLCGAIFLMSANDIVSIFISIELQSYGLYLLSSVYRNSELSTKAGLTYFLLGGLSSCIILLSQSLLYINSGNTNLDNIYVISSINNLNAEVVSNGYYINFALIVLSVGLLFKVSAAPFHFWSPDVYDNVPTIVTIFIAIIAKISIFILLLELVHFTSNSTDELLTYNWNKNLLLSSLLSLIIGTVLGITQFRIKRLYAYSTISHVGFILLALSINSIESTQAFIFYLIQYSISNLNAFIILISVGYIYVTYYNNSQEYSKLKEINNSPIQLISQIKGLYKINTALSLSFAVTLFSFLGVPPLLGFFGKQMVLSASLDSGYVFMSLVAILTSVISAAYYLVLVKQIFFEDNEYKHITLLKKTMFNVTNDGSTNVEINAADGGSVKSSINITGFVKLSANLTLIISTLTLIILVFMFTPNESLNMVKILALFIFNV